MTNTYEIMQLEAGYDIIKYDGNNQRETRKLQ